MSSRSFISAAGLTSLLVVILQAIQVLALSPLSAVGAKFFDEDGKQFYIKGVVPNHLSVWPFCRLLTIRYYQVLPTSSPMMIL